MAGPSEPNPPAHPVLVVGESLIDIVRRDGAPAEEHVGGSPANVALGLARLGVPVRLRTALGRDARGRRIAEQLAASGVTVDPESFAIERTSTATARISTAGDADYLFDIDWRIAEPLERHGAGIVHVGSIACFVEPGASALRRTVSRWAPRTAVTFDPNIRSALSGEPTAARAVVNELASLSEVVKLSDEDAAWLYPGVSLDAVLDGLLGAGVRVAAVTLGAAGAMLASASARVQVRPPRVAVHDTVGAGDTFMASLVADLAGDRLCADEESLTTAAHRAVTAAGITVGRVGANLPTRAELEAALRPAEWSDA